MGAMKYTRIGTIDKPAAKIALGSMVFTVRDDVTGCQWMEKTKEDSFRLLDEALSLATTLLIQLRSMRMGRASCASGNG